MKVRGLLARTFAPPVLIARASRKRPVFEQGELCKAAPIGVSVAAFVSRLLWEGFYPPTIEVSFRVLNQKWPHLALTIVLLILIQWLRPNHQYDQEQEHHYRRKGRSPRLTVAGVADPGREASPLSPASAKPVTLDRGKASRPMIGLTLGPTSADLTSQASSPKSEGFGELRVANRRGVKPLPQNRLIAAAC
jgi:hypothetical protein